MTLSSGLRNVTQNSLLGYRKKRERVNSEISITSGNYEVRFGCKRITQFLRDMGINYRDIEIQGLFEVEIFCGGDV